MAATAAEDNGIFAGLPPLDVKLDEILDSGNGVGFDSHFPLSTDGYMELFDLGQHFTDVPTFVGSLQVRSQSYFPLQMS